MISNTAIIINTVFRSVGRGAEEDQEGGFSEGREQAGMSAFFFFYCIPRHCHLKHFIFNKFEWVKKGRYLVNCIK